MQKKSNPHYARSNTPKRVAGSSQSNKRATTVASHWRQCPIYPAPESNKADSYVLNHSANHQIIQIFCLHFFNSIKKLGKQQYLWSAQYFNLCRFQKSSLFFITGELSDDAEDATSKRVSIRSSMLLIIPI